MHVIDLPSEEEVNNDVYSLVSKAGEDCVTEKIFRVKKVMKINVALYAIRNNFQFNVC